MPRRCYACGGIKHLSRNCPHQQPAQPAESKPESTGAVSTAANRVSQLFSDTVIEEVLISDALVNTGSPTSIVCSALYDRLSTRFVINLFNKSAPDIVEIGTRYRRNRRCEFRSRRVCVGATAHRRIRLGTFAARLLGASVRIVDRYGRLATACRKLFSV